MLEVMVAMAVFGLAMTGVFPLVAILSRDLLPVTTTGASGSTAVSLGHSSPARDWTQDDTSLTNRRHLWYVVPASDAWTRKLGASAGITRNQDTFLLAAATSVEPSVMIRDDDDDNTDVDHDGSEDYVNGEQWERCPAAIEAASYAGDCHRHAVLAVDATPSNAVWRFKVAATGWYSIQATWPADQVGDQTVAQYRVFVNDAASPLCTRALDQHAAPVGVRDADGRTWAALSTRPVHLDKDSTVRVELSAIQVVAPPEGEDRYVVADAVRLVQNVLKVRSLERAIGSVNSNNSGEDVTIHTELSVNIPQ
jgi:hypothetical protein